MMAQRQVDVRRAAEQARNMDTVTEGFQSSIGGLEEAGVAANVMDMLRQEMNKMKQRSAHLEAAEAQAEKYYTQAKIQLEANIKGFQTTEQLGRKELITQKAELAEKEAELHDLQVQLGAVQGTLATQKKDCQVSEVNDADRARRTEKEKLALQEALAILKSEGDVVSLKAGP